MNGGTVVEISDKNKSDYSILLLFDIQLRICGSRRFVIAGDRLEPTDDDKTL